MEVNKDLFAKKIGQILSMTREGVESASYEKNYDFEKKEFTEYVILHFKGGSERRINVTFDSNIAMLRDVLKAI